MRGESFVGIARWSTTEQRVVVREARLDDVPQMVALSSRKRRQYAEHQPAFWRAASDADAHQARFFEGLIEDPNAVSLILERGSRADGFLIATMRSAPPVYDPGGPTALIDDFAVADDDWESTGGPLLDHAFRACRERGAVQVVVVCGHRDEPKRSLLRAHGCAIASEWYRKPL